MKDLQTLLHEIERLQEVGESYVLATIVRIDGSAYRGVGTRMLIKANGDRIGTISGGCLERDVVENAEEVFAGGARKLLTYDSTSEEDLLWGTGLGCSGVIQVMLERLPDDEAIDYPRILIASVFGRRLTVMATLFEAEGSRGKGDGQRLILDPMGSVTSDIADERLRQLVARDAREEMTILKQTNPPIALGRTRFYDLDSIRAGVLLEPLVPPIFAGNLRRWRRRGATGSTCRRHRLASDRGRSPTGLRRCRQIARSRACPPRTGAGALRRSATGRMRHHLVMTHNYMQDLAILRKLVREDVRYLGVLGPKARTDRLLHHLGSERIVLSAEMRRILHSPVGLDIGAETAEEIALSVIAEMRAVLSGRQGGLLRLRKGPIHDRPV